MARLSPDDLVTRVYTLLNTSGTKPSSLSILDHDLLPVEPDELPVCGVYLVEDKLAGTIDGQTEERWRIATVRVEIRVTGAMLATRTIRDWAIPAVLADSTLAGLARDVEYRSFTPFGQAADHRFAGADLDFDLTYEFNIPGGLNA